MEVQMGIIIYVNNMKNRRAKDAVYTSSHTVEM